MRGRRIAAVVVPALLLATVGCNETASEGERRSRTGREAGRSARGPGASDPRGADRAPVAAVPVEVVPVIRRDISSYIETNGTLEAENEVDVVARAAGPIVALAVEEGDRVARGQLLARIDDSEYRVAVEIARVAVEETRLAHERATNLSREELISVEEFERARADHAAARAQLEAAELVLGFTRVQAPFDGRIVERHVQPAQQVTANTALFRISDFDPLLCPIQVPERELSRLRAGQRAYLTVEAFPGQRFAARVLRVRPVVDAETGTVRVTLQVDTRDLLRPGMFARAYLETETRPQALVLPKAALSLESIGDTVYVADGSVARRREVRLGFSEGDFVEVVSGVDEHERVVVVGQDGLSDGTPIQILAAGAAAPPTVAEAAGDERPGRPGPGGRGLDPASMTPEQLARAKERMRARGMSDEQIEERLRRARESADSR